jgi:hypothetical protein
VRAFRGAEMTTVRRTTVRQLGHSNVGVKRRENLGTFETNARRVLSKRGDLRQYFVTLLLHRPRGFSCAWTRPSSRNVPYGGRCNHPTIWMGTRFEKNVSIASLK